MCVDSLITSMLKLLRKSLSFFVWLLPPVGTLRLLLEVEPSFLFSVRPDDACVRVTCAQTPRCDSLLVLSLQCCWVSDSGGRHPHTEPLHPSSCSWCPCSPAPPSSPAPLPPAPSPQPGPRWEVGWRLETLGRCPVTSRTADFHLSAGCRVSRGFRS